CLGAYAHQDLPFEKLVEELRPERDLSRSPLFQVMFVFQNAPLPATVATGFTISPLEQDDGTAKFDLMLELNESSGGLAGDFEYGTDLFDRTTIARMARHFGNLLQAAVDDPGQAVAALPLLAPCERNQLLLEWNDTRAEYPAGVCIHQRIEARVDRCPDAPAVVCGQTPERVLSYRELDRRAN
ncbi:MAG: non-ribosomal peptide synthetase, partial [bacterium]|nr:non-ribosomal peptide synthetase [bacterium]